MQQLLVAKSAQALFRVLDIDLGGAGALNKFAKQVLIRWFGQHALVERDFKPIPIS